MKSFKHYTLLVVSLFFHGLLLSAAANIKNHSKFVHINSSPVISTVVVDQKGSGDFTSVQEAINAVPPNNNQWIRIHVKTGNYSEKVTIAQPFIYLEGENQQETIIQWNDHGSPDKAATFTLNADNFVASRITFKNTHDPWPNKEFGNPTARAPAAMILGDKASFYNCGFISLQDTLFDRSGRHFFGSCYIEGVIDFIWGQGQSQYSACTIYSRGSTLNPGQPGYITAQGRNTSDETSTFVFLSGSVTGDGSTYLGRGYGMYSRVIFYQTFLNRDVTPLGWDAWFFNGKESTLTYVEEGCTGPGASKTGRVGWMTKMDPHTLASFIDTKTFIDKDGWLENQPTTINIIPYICSS